MDNTLKRGIERRPTSESTAIGGGSRTLVRRSLAYGLGVLASRLTGLLREILLARTLGTSSGASALVVAQLVPGVLRGLVGDDVAQGAIATVLAEARKSEGCYLAWRVLRAFTIASSLVLALLVIAMVPTAGLAIAPLAAGLPEAVQAQAQTMFLILLPIVATSGIAATGAAALLIEARVGVLATLNAVSNIPAVIWMLAEPESAPEPIAACIAGGLCLQAVIQFWLGAGRLRRSAFAANQEAKDERSKDAERRRLGQIFRLACPVAITLGAANVSGVIDTAFAGAVSDGGPAAFDKALRLMLVPHGVMGLAVSVAVMPALFRSSGSAFIGELRTALRLQFAIVLPVAAFLFVAAEPIVTIIYARGAFDAQSVELTSSALRGMAFVVPTLAIAALGTRAWTARARPWIPARASLIAMLLNAALDALLVGPYGLFGIAFATAVSQALFGIYLLRRPRVIYSLFSAAKAAARVALPSVGVATLVQLVSLRYLGNAPTALQLLAILALFSGLFMLSIFILRTLEYRQMLSMVQVRRQHKLPKVVHDNTQT